MPHIPRQPTFSGVPPELMQPARQTHAPIPVQAPAAKPADKSEPPKPRKLRIGLAKISPHTYEPDNNQLLKTLFGKEPDVDPNTGQLVYAANPYPAEQRVSFGN